MWLRVRLLVVLLVNFLLLRVRLCVQLQDVALLLWLRVLLLLMGALLLLHIWRLLQLLRVWLLRQGVCLLVVRLVVLWLSPAAPLRSCARAGRWPCWRRWHRPRPHCLLLLLLLLQQQLLLTRA